MIVTRNILGRETSLPLFTKLHPFTHQPLPRRQHTFGSDPTIRPGQATRTDQKGALPACRIQRYAWFGEVSRNKSFRIRLAGRISGTCPYLGGNWALGGISGSVFPLSVSPVSEIHRLQYQYLADNRRLEVGAHDQLRSLKKSGQQFY